MKHPVLICLASILALASTSQVQESSSTTQPVKATAGTYCNPLSIPDYPIGKRCRDIVVGDPSPSTGGWLLDHMEQYRELAHVTVLWHEGKWYMYPSFDMAWVSSDGGITWEHHPLNVRDIGYAPAVVRHKGKFLLIASSSPLYISDSPLGPFTELGKIDVPPGLQRETDPMLFSDDDGRLYYYWGCSAVGGIYGVELDADHPTHIIGTLARMIECFEPDRYPWQRLGDWNEDANAGYIEGSWLLKRNGMYYLTYSAAGTENRTYAMGCLTSKSPLGPFTPQKNNPIMPTLTG